MTEELKLPTLLTLEYIAEDLKQAADIGKAFGLHVSTDIHNVPLPLMEQLAENHSQTIRVFPRDGFCHLEIHGVNFYCRDGMPEDVLRRRMEELKASTDDNGGWSDPKLHQEYDAILKRLGIES